MICPICDCSYSDQFKYLNCESLDGSYLYKDIHIEKCNNCGHMFNVLNDKEIRNLKKYYEEEHIKEELKNIYSLPLDDNSVEGIVFDQTLEHLTNPRLALKEAKRVLKKGGLCYINVPDADRYNDQYFWIMREHVQHFSLIGIKLIAQNCGFEIISYEKNEIDMVGTLKLPNLSVVLKPTGTIYCWGIGREFMYLYPNTRLKYLDLILVDDIKQNRTFKEMKIYSSDILKEADKDSFLIITATVHKDLLINKAKEIGYKGEIIDV